MGVCVNEGLLIDLSHTFYVAYIVSILRSKVPWVICFYLSMGNFFIFGFLQCNNLRLGQDQTFLCDFSFKGFQKLLEGLQIMTQPDATDATGRDKNALFL